MHADGSPAGLSLNGGDVFGSSRTLTAAQDESLYVNDSGRVHQFDAQGVYIKTWAVGASIYGNTTKKEGSVEKSDGQIAVASDGSLYVVDRKNHRIQKFVIKSKAATVAYPYKGIILAGGGEKFGSGRTNSIWGGTWRIAKKAYRALINQSFKSHEEIKFLTAGQTDIDLDNNQKFDDLEVATKESLRVAITEWASDATDVVIYLSNHGGPGKFKINGMETLTSEELNLWVSQLENKISGKVTVVIEACNSASFFSQLSKPGRFLLASAKSNQNAVISNNGLTSFSYTFWSEISTGATLQTAFKDARQSMSRIRYANQAQNAQAETDGNNMFTQQDLTQLGNYCLGECNKTAGAAPEVKSFSTVRQI